MTFFRRIFSARPVFLTAAALLATLPAAAQQKNAPEPPKGPDRSAAYYHYSLAHMYEELAINQGRTDYATQAIEEYKLALNADSDSAQLQNGLANLYLKLGRVREAVSVAQEQVKKNPPAIFGFLLLPGLVRDANGIKRLTLPAGVAEVALQFDVKAKGDFTSYRAELQDLDGTTLWSGKVPQPSVSIPARILRPGDYVVMLKGVSASGQASDAGDFYFRVVQR